MRDVTCSRRDLADVLGLSERRVSELTRTGVLSKPEGTRGYALVACVKAYLAFLRSKSGSLTTERSRLTKAHADLAELKLRLRTGELVERHAIESARFRQGREVRDGLLNIPSRVSGPCAAETDQHAIHSLVMREIVQTLEVLTDETTPAPSPDPGPDAARPRRARSRDPRHAHRVGGSA